MSEWSLCEPEPRAKPGTHKSNTETPGLACTVAAVGRLIFSFVVLRIELMTPTC